MLTAYQLKSAVDKYGTPLYLFDTEEIMNTVSEFRKKLGTLADLCFAMKANPFLTRQMSEITDRIEVCSEGEYRICRTLEICPEKILISGVLKEKRNLLEILDFYRGACTYSIESPSQFYSMASWSEEHCEILHVYFRLTSGNQFGMDEETIACLMKECDQYPFLKVKGIHYFSGTQKKSIDKIQKELIYLDKFCRRIGNVEELEYGPGIPAFYFQNQENKMNDYITGIAESISTMTWKGKITLEMGRALTASCGYYLTAVQDVKKSNGKNFCITDGGIHQLQYDGQIRGMYQPELQILRKRMDEETEKEKESWTVCGSLCTANDILIQNLKTEALETEDILVFEQTGAYSAMEGMALFLSHELPAVVIRDKETGWKLIRKKRSTYHWNMEKEIKNGSIDENFRRTGRQH